MSSDAIQTLMNPPTMKTKGEEKKIYIRGWKETDVVEFSQPIHPRLWHLMGQTEVETMSPYKAKSSL